MASTETAPHVVGAIRAFAATGTGLDRLLPTDGRRSGVAGTGLVHHEHRRRRPRPVRHGWIFAIDDGAPCIRGPAGCNASDVRVVTC